MATLMRTLRILFQPKKSLRWYQASPTIFRRNIDAVEGFHVTSGSENVPQGRRRLDLTATVNLQVGNGNKPTRHQARKAWIALRRKHPAMASVIQGSKRVYYRMDHQERQAWLDETFVNVPGEHALTPEVLNRYKATSRPTMYFLEDAHMFALRTPHYTMDGLGVFSLLGEYLAELGRIANKEQNACFDEQPSDLASCLEEAVQPTFPSPRQLLRLWRIRRNWLQSYPSIAIKPDKIDYSSISSWKDLQFSNSETKCLLARAKQNGLSLTHVAHAALIIGAMKHGVYPEGSNYTQMIVLNMRGRAADMSSHVKNIASTQHAIWPFTLPVSTCLLDVAEQMKQIYMNAVGDPDLLSLAGPIFIEGMRTIPASSHLFHSSPFVSSCGKLDNVIAPSYGTLYVENVSIMAEISQEDIVAIVWSYKGQLTIRVFYNEGKHSASNIQRYIQLTGEVLKKGFDMTQ
ncbi:hypothetical protein N7448_006519 [Penicillium atrosanguineum]|nr:hypothetical protein N7448_006519 [Penicillium atrosanguineum]KAJ5137426.1 hypothetical protein N7526_003659 [Penicillium atrosanguineum]